MLLSTSSTRVFVLFFFFSLLSCAQYEIQAQQIQVIKQSRGHIAKTESELLKPKQIRVLMKNNPEALAAFKKYDSNKAPANVLGFIAGGLIGWPTGTAIAGGDPNWALALTGVGLMVLTIPLAKSGQKHLHSAVDMYNSGLSNVAPQQHPRMQYAISFGGNGLGLALSF